jgi:hypothetical protein
MENKENIFIKKLKEESNNEFINCVSLFESSEYIKIKKIFYYFLYNDILKIDINNKNNFDIDINNILNNPSEIINQNLQNTYSKIINYNDNLVLEFKKELIKKVGNIKNKINECKSHIDMIKKEYINMSLEKYLPSNNKKTIFMFENKTILTLFKKQDELILSEFFTKLIFYLVYKKKNNNTDIKTYFDKFYDNDKINSYIDKIDDTTFQIKKFNDIDNNFKYWIIILFLTNQIFSQKSKYIIFNNNEFDEHIKSILAPKKEPNKKKDKKKDKKNLPKKKAKGGGKNKEFNKIISARKNNLKKKDKKNNKKNDKKNKKSETIKFYDLFYENKIINIKKNNSFEKKSFKDIYFDSFNHNIRLYFYTELIKITSDNPLEEKIVDKIFINHPFNSSKKISAKILIKDTFKKLTKKIIEDEKLNLFNTDIKFNLYESLYLLLEQDNYNEVQKFIENIKSKLLLILFYLYNIKMIIYNSYLEKINDIFNIDLGNKKNNKKINVKNNVKNEENNTKEDNQKIEIKNTINSDESSNISNKLNNLKNKSNNSNDIIPITTENLNTQIKKKQIELSIVKDDIGIRNYDNKILQLEKELKNLIVSKYIIQIKKNT